jgi:hypothetical protein
VAGVAYMTDVIPTVNRSVTAGMAACVTAALPSAFGKRRRGKCKSADEAEYQQRVCRHDHCPFRLLTPTAHHHAM